MIKTAVYAGSFDPITLGHVDVIKRAAKLFDKVLVVVSINTSKHTLFTIDERVDIVKGALADLTNVSVTKSEELTVNFAIKHQANFLVRGVRGSADIDSEISISDLNEQLASNIQTIFLPTSPNYRALSSTMIKEIARFNGDITKMVPENVATALRAKFE
ncbi:pantetheine-phosphate adenylyltransferase [Lentilactobacillus curieae]|uniref:Phosphopantetheine adenylyltransferase n=1 Tax=Lentilactobacillus curieae TaxID=1138822 RepID=A0A1S6QG03_9LACO|nr:pantetheine-phosphate adenylyltransferase [Lentilactobacillus curieae]AQW20531.1 pantetheine-phosphate adenylyltransferase [Lentilactobacillus curieae]